MLWCHVCRGGADRGCGRGGGGGGEDCDGRGKDCGGGGCGDRGGVGDVVVGGGSGDGSFCELIVLVRLIVVVSLVM